MLIKIPNTELKILIQSLFNSVIPDFFFSQDFIRVELL